MIRRFFWNIRTAFLGEKLVPLGAKQFLYYPLAVGLPVYVFSVVQSGNIY